MAAKHSISRSAPASYIKPAEKLFAWSIMAGCVTVSTVGGNGAMVTNLAILLLITPLAINFCMGALVGIGGQRREKKPVGTAKLHAVA